MKKKELIERLTVAEAAGAALRIELEETREALSRSRKYSDMLKATLNSNRIIPIEEAARRLMNTAKAFGDTFPLTFRSENERDHWMGKFISIIS